MFSKGGDRLMSRAPIISNTINHDFSSTKVDLPRSNEAYAEIFSYTGYGDFHALEIAFNSDEILFKLEIDNNIFIEVDIEELDSLFGVNDRNNYTPLNFSNSKKSLFFGLGYPIQFKEGFKVYCKANSNSNTRDMKGYSIFFTKDNL